MGTTTLSATRRRVGYARRGARAAGVGGAAPPDLPIWRLDRVLARSARSAAGPAAGAHSCVDCHAPDGGGDGESYQRVALFEPARASERGRPRTPPVRIAASLTLSPMPEPEPATTGRPAGGICPPNGPPNAGDRPGPANTPALLGLALVDQIPGWSIAPPGLSPRVVRLAGSGAVVPGRPRVLPHGRVGKFGRQAQYATLIEFVVTAAEEDPRSADPEDVDRFYRHSDRIRQARGFIAGLPRPSAVPPDSAEGADAARRGEARFIAVGCVACHTPDLGGVRGVYGDFLLHRLDDRAHGVPDEPPPPTAPPLPGEWRTAPLWGVADSAPYLHDGSAPTLEAAIARHRGDAEPVTQAYDRLDGPDRRDLIAFLRTLRAPRPAPDMPMANADGPSRAD